jgi:hypothetical protein
MRLLDPVLVIQPLTFSRASQLLCTLIACKADCLGYFPQFKTDSPNHGAPCFNSSLFFQLHPALAFDDSGTAINVSACVVVTPIEIVRLLEVQNVNEAHLHRDACYNALFFKCVSENCVDCASTVLFEQAVPLEVSCK